MKENNNLIAKVMKNVAHKSAVAAVDSRCMYIYHQPKAPKSLKMLKK